MQSGNISIELKELMRTIKPTVDGMLKSESENMYAEYLTEYLLKAEEFFKAQLYDKAISACEAALEYLKDDAYKKERAKLFRSLACMMELKNDTEAAIQFLIRAISEDPENVGAYHHLGSYYEVRKQWDLALYYYSQGMQLKPHPIELVKCRARVYEALGRYDEASADYDRIRFQGSQVLIKALEKKRETIQNLMFSYAGFWLKKVGYGYIEKLERLLKQDDSAIKIMQEVRVFVDQCNKNNFNGELVDFYIRELFILISNNVPTEDLHRLELGIKQSLKMKSSQALPEKETSQIVKELKANYFPTRNELAQRFQYQKRAEIAFSKGQFDLAIEYCSKSIEMNPRDTDMCLLRGKSYALQGKYDLAISDYNCAMDYSVDVSTTKRLHLLRGESYRKQGKYLKALADFNVANASEKKKEVLSQLQARLSLIRELVSDEFFWKNKAGYEYINKLVEILNTDSPYIVDVMRKLQEIEVPTSSNSSVPIDSAVVMLASVIVNGSVSFVETLKDQMMKERYPLMLKLIAELVYEKNDWETKAGSKHMHEICRILEDTDNFEIEEMTAYAEKAKSDYKADFFVLRFLSAIASDPRDALILLDNLKNERQEVQQAKKLLEAKKHIEMINEIVLDINFWKDKAGNNYIDKIRKIILRDKKEDAVTKMQKIKEIAEGFVKSSSTTLLAFKTKVHPSVSELLNEIHNDSCNFTSLKEKMASELVARSFSTSKSMTPGIGNNDL